MPKIGRRKDGKFYPKNKANGGKGISAETFRKLKRQNDSRSLAARALDDHLKAKIDPTGKKWRQAPNRYDVKGIDYPGKGHIRLKDGSLWPVYQDDEFEIVG